ncbi:MAG: aspartate--tRNA(Asn) ligase [Patescibacteria group bacterium]
MVKILTVAESLPFDMGSAELNLELPTLLDHRCLTLRHASVAPIFKVQETILDAFRKAAQQLECTEVVVPTISASATEGGAEVFFVDYFGHKAFLTQSPQLYKQMVVPVFERVYTVAKAYRAEPSVTTRHLTEATQMDCEFGFVDFTTLLDYLETVGTSMLKAVEAKDAAILEMFKVPKAFYGKIPRFKMHEVQEIIFKEFGRDVRGEKDLSPQDEVDICSWARQKYESDFVTVTHYPTKKRAFYTRPDPEEPEFSLSFDLLFRGLEILSGSQRINDYNQLVAAIAEHGMDPKNYEMYLMAFKYGMPPEGGFSFGLERLTKQFLNLTNVREASLFPRDMERIDFRLGPVIEGPTPS